MFTFCLLLSLFQPLSTYHFSFTSFIRDIFHFHFIISARVHVLKFSPYLIWSVFTHLTWLFLHFHCLFFYHLEHSISSLPLTLLFISLCTDDITPIFSYYLLIMFCSFCAYISSTMLILCLEQVPNYVGNMCQIYYSSPHSQGDQGFGDEKGTLLNLSKHKNLKFQYNN